MAGIVEFLNFRFAKNFECVRRGNEKIVGRLEVAVFRPK